MPGLWLAVGVCIGNVLFISILSGSIAKGIIAGAASGILVILIHQVVPGLKSNK